MLENELLQSTIFQVGAYGQGAGMPGGLPVQPVVSGAGVPAPNTEWAVPMPTRAKYQATFYQTDRARTGFLAGNQVRCFMITSRCCTRIKVLAVVFQSL